MPRERDERGRFVRAIGPPSVPNGNPLDATTAPHTVGPDVVTPGDSSGVEWAGRIPPPAAWSGWPADWGTSWGMGAMSAISTCTDTAWACLDLNSNVLSTMPVYRTDGHGAQLPTVAWMRNPDPDLYASWEMFAKEAFWSFQVGEVFLLCTARFANGWPARFHVVEPWTVEVRFVAGLRRFYLDRRDVTADMLWVPYASSPSLERGYGPLEAGRARLVAASVLCRYATTLAQQGGVPTFAITHPDELTARQIGDLQQQWLASRVANLGLPAVLSGGVTLETLQVNPRDMALVELATFNEARIAVLMGTPPTLVGLPSGEGSLVYNNVQSIYDYWWRAWLRPKAQTLMSALSAWALPYGQTAELNRDEITRPGLGERAQAYATLHGIEDETGRGLYATEVRTMERFGTTPVEADPPSQESALALTGGAP
jgi:hypothetical protein